jgi:aubergine
MQICAKLGGEPWAIENIPLLNKPTMVIGIDVYNKAGMSIIAFCGSYNIRLTKYVSTVKYETQGKEIHMKIKEGVIELVNQVYIYFS